MEKNLNITKPRYRERTLSLPWPFAIIEVTISLTKSNKKRLCMTQSLSQQVLFYSRIPKLRFKTNRNHIKTFCIEVLKGGSRIFFRRGCTRLLLYFNTNKPHSFFFAEYQLYQKTAGHLRGGGTHPLHPPPRSAPGSPSFTNTVKPRV